MRHDALLDVGTLTLEGGDEQRPDARRRKSPKRQYRWDSRRKWCYRTCHKRDRYGRWASLRRKQRNPPFDAAEGAAGETAGWGAWLPWLVGGAALLLLLQPAREGPPLPMVAV